MGHLDRRSAVDSVPCRLDQFMATPGKRKLEEPLEAFSAVKREAEEVKREFSELQEVELLKSEVNQVNPVNQVTDICFEVLPVN